MTTERQSEILDIRTLVPPQRVLKVPERRKYNYFWELVFHWFPKLRPADPVREIDVSKTSAKVTLQLMLQVGKFAKLAQAEDENAFNELLGLLVLMFKPSFPDVTMDWIQENMTMEQIIGAFQFCIEPLKEQVGKNPAAAQYLARK